MCSGSIFFIIVARYLLNNVVNVILFLNPVDITHISMLSSNYIYQSLPIPPTRVHSI